MVSTRKSRIRVDLKLEEKLLSYTITFLHLLFI